MLVISVHTFHSNRVGSVDYQVGDVCTYFHNDRMGSVFIKFVRPIHTYTVIEGEVFTIKLMISAHTFQSNRPGSV